MAPECGGRYAAAQPSGLKTRSVDAGYFASIAAGRMGRLAKLPPQLGHFPLRTPSTQSLQNVHSNVQIIASGDSGGRSRSQHSQFGRSASISASLDRRLDGVHRTDFLRSLDDLRFLRVDLIERGPELVDDVERHHHRAV